MITVEHYRLITGACEAGCRLFMDEHDISYKIIEGKTVADGLMKAKDLLPLLKKSNAYGYETFKKLVTF